MNELELVSFIFVNRGSNSLFDAIKNIQKVYSNINKEILIIEQADDLPFLRGQLFNIGVKYAQGKYIALSDSDMFHLREVPWIDIYNTYKKPIIGFKYISQITLNNDTATITRTDPCPTGFGGFNFMERSDFINFNGFSNLFIGWGFEDNEYSMRFNYIRVPQNLGHITHPIRNYAYPKNREYNLELYNSAKTRDTAMDGFKQTTYNLVSEEYIDNCVKLIKVNNISVIDNFVYTSELNKHYKLLESVK